jgi:heptaprenyl diphosphate synthase
LVALAMIFSYVEVMIPFNFGIPGVKLGLANLVVVTALYLLGFKQALLISVVRMILIAFTFGSLAALIYSLAGGLASLFLMSLLQKSRAFSVPGISAAGGFAHHIGQLAVAALAADTLSLFRYLPILGPCGLLTGLLIGLLARQILNKTEID